VAVVSDLIAVAQPQASAAPAAATTRPHQVSSDFLSPHYVRFTVKDRPGIIASLATIFSEEDINIDSVLQKPGYSKSSLPFVIAFEACSASALEKALARTRQLDFLVQPPVSSPILK
jgi:homoserine dehydrogenase